MSAVLPGRSGVLREALLHRLQEPDIQRITAIQQLLAHHLLDLALVQGAMEVVRDYATPLAVVAAGDVLGLTFDETRQLAILQCTTPGETLESLSIGIGTAGNDALKRFLRTALGQRQSVRSAGASRSRSMPSGLLGSIAKATASGRIAERDAEPFAQLLLFALVDNLVNFIGNAVITFATNPAALDVLAHDDVAPAECIDELLRLDGPVHFIRLTAMHLVTVAGETIPPGGDILVGLAAANRDPDQYEHPHQLSWSRSPRNHLAFGWGGGYCIGARLARREAMVALGAFAQRVKTVELPEAGGERRTRPEVVHGWRRLPVHVTARV